jgi:hypothetical protein
MKRELSFDLLAKGMHISVVSEKRDSGSGRNLFTPKTNNQYLGKQGQAESQVPSVKTSSRISSAKSKTVPSKKLEGKSYVDETDSPKKETSNMWHKHKPSDPLPQMLVNSQKVTNVKDKTSVKISAGQTYSNILKMATAKGKLSDSSILNTTAGKDGYSSKLNDQKSNKRIPVNKGSKKNVGLNNSVGPKGNFLTVDQSDMGCVYEKPISIRSSNQIARKSSKKNTEP